MSSAGSGHGALAHRVVCAALAIASSACAAPGAELGGDDLRADGVAADVGIERGAIVDGTYEEGRPEVVFLYRLDGAACTGSIIASRVVLTANHCVDAGGGPAPAEYFRVYVGSSRRTLAREYRVAEVRPVPNAGFGMDANDVALLVLASDAAESPLQLARTDPADLYGQSITAVGYGQTPTGGSGTKYTTTALVNGYQSGYVFVEPAVCQGDSGGPLLGPDGLVYGVASFIFSPDGRTEPSCGTAPGAYNEIYRHLAFIDEVLEETGSCAPDASGEVCDGGDNDCDGEVDEGCTPLGDPCEVDSECTGGLCRQTAAGRVCTSACDPLRPEVGCAPGFYCAGAGGCEGYCLPGLPGELPLEAECEQDTDCDSMFCTDPGDGRRRCLAPCRGDAGLCLAGEVCAAPVDGCGGCVPRELVRGARGLGEPCEADGECRGDMVCHDVAGISECASACAEDDACADGFECRDMLCVRDRQQGVGGVCQGNGDCGGGICAAQGERRWCTAPCESADDCPGGFDCVAAGGGSVCAPVAALDGETCEANEDCASGICAHRATGSVCTSFCDPDNACAPGFECERVGDGRNACLVPPAQEVDGGCAVRPSAGEGGARLSLIGATLLALALLSARRRRR